MHQPNPNYQQDQMSEDQQAANLPRLVELLNNIWFKHFVAVWTQERDRSREAVCLFPLRNIQDILISIQTRGDANTFDRCLKEPYETYNNIVKEKEQNERTNSDTRP